MFFGCGGLEVGEKNVKRNNWACQILRQSKLEEMHWNQWNYVDFVHLSFKQASRRNVKLNIRFLDLVMISQYNHAFGTAISIFQAWNVQDNLNFLFIMYLENKILYCYWYFFCFLVFFQVRFPHDDCVLYHRDVLSSCCSCCSRLELIIIYTFKTQKKLSVSFSLYVRIQRRYIKGKRW